MSDPQSLDALAWLFGLEHFGIKFGLGNIQAITSALGHPERAYATVHVAGTNGKGSVTAMVDAALRAAGHRSARYTSPHLVDLTERFAVSGRPVDPRTLAEIIQSVRLVVERLRQDGQLEVHPTFFEVTTAVAFEVFRRAGVRIAVIEVGLGGRLDATNVVAPAVTAITSIGFDHQQYLGRTLPEIAVEKAGIIKPGIPVVVGRMDREAREAIEAVAQARGAPVVDASSGPLRLKSAPGVAIEVGLRGAHQIDNARVALAVLEQLNAGGFATPAPAAARGIANVAWPGRLDIRRLAGGEELLLDAAHNAEGASALAAYLRTSPFKGSPLVLAAMRDKDAAAIISALAPEVGSLVLTRASNARSMEPAELEQHARRAAPALPVSTVATVEDALHLAFGSSPRAVAAGSIFLLGDVIRLIGDRTPPSTHS